MQRRLRYFLFENKDLILRNYVGRLFYYWLHRLIAFFFVRFRADYYAALASLLRYERDVSELVGKTALAAGYNQVIKRFVDTYVLGDKGNLVRQSFAASAEAESIRRTFGRFGLDHLVRMKYRKNNDSPERMGDLLVLKPYQGPEEKGILFIQYDEGVKRFAALFDLQSLAVRYRFVVEPSTTGYQNPMFFLLLGLPTEVVFESQFESDYRYIESIGENFLPIRLGAGDWADPEIFRDCSEKKKTYDLVMIANWLKWKRHDLLFAALSKIKNHINKVAVIGYPTENRTLEDVRKEAKRRGVEDKVDFFNRIPHTEVAQIICHSKVGILLSPEEGANRGIYECFFSGVPIILTATNRGVNRDHINNHTGTLAKDNELHHKILETIANYQSFDPRSWALRETGYRNSTVTLNSFFRQLATSKGERWTTDIYYKHNSPHARYKEYSEWQRADRSFADLLSFVRSDARRAVKPE